MAKAAVTRSIRDDHQKNFLKIFNGLTGKHSRWEIWEDFVTLTAIEISNSTDKVNAPERTKMYQTIISKYSAKERDGMAEMLAEVVMGMEQNPDQDFLGSLYMMCELGNDHAGQFFTPYDVCRCMAEITFDPKLHPDMEGFISVSDPACGAGATLLAFLNVCKRRNICYHNKVLVIAQDIDFIVGLMCYIQCSFMGCAGYVVIGDTLVNPATAYDSREYIAKCVDEGGDAAAAAAAWTPKAVWSSEDYTIIIGHRRAAAAQQAGLYELPCAIVEMDEREQMQTMMIENMQRSDLTVYEQAQGFQMMMDFGQTVEQISDKSGFSQSTIRRRIKLLELNRDSFKKAEKRGATLSDFAQLDKIEDLEARNRVLETLGTQNFNRAMQDALEQQNGSTKRPNGLSS